MDIETLKSCGRGKVEKSHPLRLDCPHITILFAHTYNKITTELSTQYEARKVIRKPVQMGI